MDKSSTVGGEQLELFLQHFDIIFTWPLDKTYMARMIQSNKEEWFILEKKHTYMSKKHSNKLQQSRQSLLILQCPVIRNPSLSL